MDMGPSGGQRVSHSTRVLLNIMLAALTMKALCAVPVELLVMADVLQRELQSMRGIRLSERQSLQLRMLLWLLCVAVKQLLRRRVRRVLFIFIIIKKMWTEWASSSFRTDARLKQRGFVVVVEIVVDIAAAAETREDPSSSQK